MTGFPVQPEIPCRVHFSSKEVLYRCQFAEMDHYISQIVSTLWWISRILRDTLPKRSLALKYYRPWLEFLCTAIMQEYSSRLLPKNAPTIGATNKRAPLRASSVPITFVHLWLSSVPVHGTPVISPFCLNGIRSHPIFRRCCPVNNVVVIPYAVCVGTYLSIHC